jgi:hypothetical protein
MPEKLIRSIKKGYVKKGMSPKKAEDIAYKTVNKMGKLEHKHKAKKK